MNAATRMGIAAHALAWAAFIFFLVVPTYSGVSVSNGVQRETSATLIEMNGWAVLWIIAVPVVITGIGLWVLWLTQRGPARWQSIALWSSVVSLGLACLIGIWSVGLLYLPALAALLIATILRPRFAPA